MRPFISVIIPNYNHSLYLDERINSVLNQSYDNYEVIILDDKSSDNSVEVINKYKEHPKVTQIIINEVNSGSAFIQWHRGFSAAKGDLIWIAESDDTCEPNLLEKLVREFELHSDLSLSFCRSLKINEKGIVIGKRIKASPSTYMNGITFIKKHLCMINFVANASSALFKKEIAKSLDKDYMNYKGCGDWLFWTELAEKGNVSIVNQQLNYFRQHGDNTTSSNSRKGINVIEIRKIYDYLRGKNYLNIYQRFKINLKYTYAIYYEINFLSQADKDHCAEVWRVNPFMLFCAKIKKLLNR